MKTYLVLPSVETLLPRLIEDGYLLGLVTGNGEAAVQFASLTRCCGAESDRSASTDAVALPARGFV